MSSQEKYLQNALRKNLDRVSAPNRILLERFIDRRTNAGLALSTTSLYAQAVGPLDAFVKGKPLTTVTGDDLTQYLKSIRPRYTPKTMVGHATLLRSFLRWCLGVRVLPVDLDDALRVRDKRGIPKIQPITAEELQRLENALTELRDKALLRVLADSGFRASEILALNLESIQLDPAGGAYLHLPPDGKFLKTGPRSIYVRDCLPWLKAWIQMHPATGFGKAPLFPSYRTKDGLTRLGVINLNGLFRRAYKAGGVRKVHPHLFRHTRATQCARARWNESQMRAYFGWAWNSVMPAYYTHLVAQDMKDQILRDAGVRPSGPDSGDGLPPAAMQPMPPTPPAAGIAKPTSATRRDLLLRLLLEEMSGVPGEPAR